MNEIAYRNGTYVAFDGLGETDPTKSDFRYYATIQAWANNKNIEFNFVNSHEKTYAVKDTSLKATLEARIRERLANSKNVIVILSNDTRSCGSMLSYEIEQAVDNYKLPLIITYVDHVIVSAPNVLKEYWPFVLKVRIDNNMAKAIHIPFIKGALLDAINQFNISSLPNSSLDYYTKLAHQQFGINFPLGAAFINTKN